MIAKKVIASLVHAVDRRLPRPRVGGRESSEAYSLWEYRTGKRILDSYSERLGNLAGKRVLDVGCGLGGKTVAYAEAGARVTGVDILRGNISRCVEFARARGAAAAFVSADAERLPFGGETFDAIIANDSLEHFENPEGALCEFARVLKPGGSMFLFFTPWGSPLGSHLYDYIRTPWCHLLFPEWLLGALIERELAVQGVDDPPSRSRRLMDEYHSELNRITVRRYRRIVREIPDIVPSFEELKPPKFAWLAPLAHVPLAGELFTGTVAGVLVKRHSP
jgi:ubiquinone/menaquinone biosynthesis C-methylase UbiE